VEVRVEMFKDSRADYFESSPYVILKTKCSRPQVALHKGVDIIENDEVGFSAPKRQEQRLYDYEHDEIGRPPVSW
jgi:hypothetical protein